MKSQFKKEYRKEYLTGEELSAIANLKLSMLRQRQARDIFLFSCHTGMAYRDLGRLRKDNILVLSREKRFLRFYIAKSGLFCSFPLLDVPYDILKQYWGLQENGGLLPDLPLPAINYELQKICMAAGIGKSITLHSARRTFALTVAPEKGITTCVVMRMLGHHLLEEALSKNVSQKKISCDMAIAGNKFKGLAKIFK